MPAAGPSPTGCPRPVRPADGQRDGDRGDSVTRRRPGGVRRLAGGPGRVTSHAGGGVGGLPAGVRRRLPSVAWERAGPGLGPAGPGAGRGPGI